jgi:hypothetical protein
MDSIIFDVGNIMMKKLILLWVLLFLGANTSFAQDTLGMSHPLEHKPSLSDRLFYGGDLSLNFGDVTYIYLAPTVGYKVTPKFGVGLGPSYSYLNDKRFAGYHYETSTYGGRAFAQYRIIEQALLYTEYELVNAEVYNLLQTKLVRANIGSLFVGGGYIAPIGANSNFTIMGLWNVAPSQYSYYENPIIRAGFNIGF